MPDSGWKENVSFVLVCPREAGNIGASARALKNFGFSGLELVAPRKFPAEEANWFAHGALDILEKTKIHESLKDALKGKTLAAGTSRRTGKQRGAACSLKEGVKRLKSHALEGRRVSILFGSEDRGLTNGQAEECAFLMNIPAGPAMPSFNLSQAVLLVSYELFLAMPEQPVGAGHPEKGKPAKKLAAREELSFFYERLREALDLLHYTPRGNKDMEITILKNLKHILSRAEITRWELKMLHGLLSQAENRLK
ncbi:MAG: hypothetical protein M0Z58_07275 [Nitrospiraceae bacterium]|nr:hypothetical protein [Nitrospiraceae bacterium]